VRLRVILLDIVFAQTRFQGIGHAIPWRLDQPRGSEIMSANP